MVTPSPVISGPQISSSSMTFQKYCGMRYHCQLYPMASAPWTVSQMRPPASTVN